MVLGVGDPFLGVAQQDYTEFYHADEAITYITDYMKLHGPYDGLIGFSQVKYIENMDPMGHNTKFKT